jgi:cobalt-zinc-cadmium efflux system outer membrane protein
MDHSTRATSAPQPVPVDATTRPPTRRTRRRIAASLAGVALVVATAARADDGAAAGTPAGVARGTLTLRDALLHALRESPLLPASSLELRAREAEALQAGLLPNPSLTTEVEDFGGGGARNDFDASQTTVSLAQLIELGGKRAARVRLADADADLARWDFESLRMDVLSGVAKTFLATLAAQEKLALTEELRRIAHSSVATVTRTVESGAVSPVEEGRARVLLSQVEIEREQRARDLEQTRLALAATWGSAEPGFGDVAGSFDAVREPATLEQLRAAVERNPDLARWTSEIEQRAATLSLAEARSVPDLTVSAGGRYYQDEQSGGIVALFSVPLPVFDRNQGAIRAAEERLGRAKVEQRASELGVRSAVARAHQAQLAAYRQVTELRERTIPEAEAVFRGAQDAYARGLFRYLEVLDAQRTLFQLRASYVDALLAYHLQTTDIARLTGKDPSDGSDAASRDLP